jgi:hypothetical protein
VGHRSPGQTGGLSSLHELYVRTAQHSTGGSYRLTVVSLD